MEKELSGYSTKASSGAAGTRAGSTQRTALLSQVAALLLPKGREGGEEKCISLQAHSSPNAGDVAFPGARGKPAV